MRLKLKQKSYSWRNSSNVNDEYGQKVFVVKGKFTWGHKLVIYNSQGEEVGMLRQVMMTMIPKYKMYIDGHYRGMIKKNYTLLKPSFTLEYYNTIVKSSWIEWDYTIYNNEQPIIYITEEVSVLTNNYVIDADCLEYALDGLLITLAIDALIQGRHRG